MFLAMVLIVQILNLISFLVALRVAVRIPMAGNGYQIRNSLPLPVIRRRLQPNSKTRLCLPRSHTCLQEFSDLNTPISSLFHQRSASGSGSISTHPHIAISIPLIPISLLSQTGSLFSIISVRLSQLKLSHRHILSKNSLFSLSSLVTSISLSHPLQNMMDHMPL